MRTNKFRLSLAVAGLLVAAGNAAAETDGFFAGVQVGLGSISADATRTMTEHRIPTSYYGDSISVVGNGVQNAPSFRYGIMAGYKQFFTQNFGLRYYGVFDYGTATKHDLAYYYENRNKSQGYQNGTHFLESELSTWNANANVDVLANFITRGSLEFGIFGGLSLGYTSSKGKGVADDGDTYNGTTGAYTYTYHDIKASGFDLGVNFGFRANIAKRHGVELYTRFGLLGQEKEITTSPYTDNGNTSGTYAEEVFGTLKVRQPYAVGLRYVFSF